MITSLCAFTRRYPFIEMPSDLRLLAQSEQITALRVVTCFSLEMAICPVFMCLS